MVKPKPFTRAGGEPLKQGSPRWFIKGSYVLDIIFGRNCAQDVDVFCDVAAVRVTQSEVKTWLEERGWWLPPKGIEVVQGDTASYETRDGGDQKRLNVDTLHINMDGSLGIACLNGSSVPISLEDARSKLTVEKLRWLHSFFMSDDRIYLKDKVLRKMNDHPELENSAMRAELEAILNSPEESC